MWQRLQSCGYLGLLTCGVVVWSTLRVVGMCARNWRSTNCVWCGLGIEPLKSFSRVTSAACVYGSSWSRNSMALDLWKDLKSSAIVKRLLRVYGSSWSWNSWHLDLCTALKYSTSVTSLLHVYDTSRSWNSLALDLWNALKSSSGVYSLSAWLRELLGLRYFVVVVVVVTRSGNFLLSLVLVSSLTFRSILLWFFSGHPLLREIGRVQRRLMSDSSDYTLWSWSERGFFNFFLPAGQGMLL